MFPFSACLTQLDLCKERVPIKSCSRTIQLHSTFSTPTLSVTVNFISMLFELVDPPLESSLPLPSSTLKVTCGASVSLCASSKKTVNDKCHLAA